MSKECKYISKAEVKEYKKVLEDVFPKVRSDVKSEYKKSFNVNLVGSAKRNLVIKKGDSHWDVDYQMMFLSPVFQDASPAELKNFIKDSFKKHLGGSYSVENSTSVITICLLDDKGKHAIKSFDIALLKINNKTQNKEILRGTSDDSSSEHYIRWEELGQTSNISSNVKKIKGSVMWGTLREIFKGKKCSNMLLEKKEQKPTYSLYSESLRETIDKCEK